MEQILSRTRELFSYTTNLRREFHRHPELGFQEHQTAGIILRELARLEGFQIQSRVGGTGILATLAGNRPGKTVLLRFDMDALPVEEQTGLEFSSLNPGLMHACGHDGHLAIGVTVARLLSELNSDFPGETLILFQPAEEGLGGAQRMIEEGALEDPRPDAALGLHLWNEKPVGWLGISDGPVMSASETFHLEIIGRGGHGAIPQEAIDPIPAAGAVILSLQQLVSREIAPLDSAVVTISTIRAGTAHNVIPDRVKLSGTIRSFTPETRQTLLMRFQELVEGICQAHGCQAAVRIEEICPAVVNHPEVAAVVRETASRLNPDWELDQNYQTMASEDMALLMQEVPGCYALIGSANPDRGLTARHHQPDFNFDEAALVTGAALMLGAAISLQGS